MQFNLPDIGFCGPGAGRTAAERSGVKAERFVKGSKDHSFICALHVDANDRGACSVSNLKCFFTNTEDASGDGLRGDVKVEGGKMSTKMNSLNKVRHALGAAQSS